MKKQRDAKKLNLQREQIRSLTPAKLDQVVGGQMSGDGGSGPSSHTHKASGG